MTAVMRRQLPNTAVKGFDPPVRGGDGGAGVLPRRIRVPDRRLRVAATRPAKGELPGLLGSLRLGAGPPSPEPDLAAG